ncbi:MAG: hypothetical protein AAFU53_03865 [Cyanobacteria bacterium J06632_3]
MPLFTALRTSRAGSTFKVIYLTQVVAITVVVLAVEKSIYSLGYLAHFSLNYLAYFNQHANSAHPSALPLG